MLQAGIYEVCIGESSAATVYRENPNIKAQDLRFINSELQDLIDTTDTKQLSKRIRGKLAKIIEFLVTDHWYTNLEEDDRDIVCKQILESSREIQDRDYYFSLARDYSYASVLDFILINGWDGGEESKQKLEEYRKGLIEMCQAHCNLLMKIARAKAEGREITEVEKDDGKTTVMLNEGMRRALAGEEIFDKE